MNNYQKISCPDIDTLVKENYHLVKKIAWHLHGRVQAIIEIEDIIQIGMLGLISAAQIINLRRMPLSLLMLILESEVKY
jgi:DNA-directed RNA polymerase specialized sigma subunit